VRGGGGGRGGGGKSGEVGGGRKVAGCRIVIWVGEGSAGWRELLVLGGMWSGK